MGKQAEFHKELTEDLKKEIRDIVIFYQRRLKSQKGLINICEFERRQIEVEIDGKKRLKLLVVGLFLVLHLYSRNLRYGRL